MNKAETVTCTSCGFIFSTAIPTMGLESCTCGNISCDSTRNYIRTLSASNDDAEYKEVLIDDVEFFHASDEKKKQLLKKAIVLKSGWAKPKDLHAIKLPKSLQ